MLGRVRRPSRRKRKNTDVLVRCGYFDLVSGRGRRHSSRYRPTFAEALDEPAAEQPEKTPRKRGGERPEKCKG
jgi:hypothetical protein